MVFGRACFVAGEPQCVGLFVDREPPAGDESTVGVGVGFGEVDGVAFGAFGELGGVEGVVEEGLPVVVGEVVGVFPAPLEHVSWVVFGSWNRVVTHHVTAVFSNGHGTPVPVPK